MRRALEDSLIIVSRGFCIAHLIRGKESIIDEAPERCEREAARVAA